MNYFETYYEKEIHFFIKKASHKSDRSTMAKTKIRAKPISRKFWSYLTYLPKKVRAPLLRSQFQISYDLPKELILKQAETTDEITQALNLVYQSYIDLDYMDPNEAQLRLTKYNILPTTIILIAKYNDEVVGTLSIIPDSALGIPSELTFNIDNYRNNNIHIAEISSLAIKKGFRKQRGKLLLPLCKLMYLFCTEILKLDGIIVSTLPDVEPFYTDILLFEKNKTHSTTPNNYAKGASTTCCFLPLNENTVKDYKKTYGKKTKEFNLHHFFVESVTENIILPESKICFQSYTKKQNMSIAEILKVFPQLTQSFTEKERMILNNIDVSELYNFNSQDQSDTRNRNNKRYHIKQKVRFFSSGNNLVYEAYIADMSKGGLKLVLQDSLNQIKNDDEILLFFNHQKKIVRLNAKVLWGKNKRILGCQITEASGTWNDFYQAVYNEILEVQNIIHFPTKKMA